MSVEARCVGGCVVASLRFLGSCMPDLARPTWSLFLRLSTTQPGLSGTLLASTTPGGGRGVERRRPEAGAGADMAAGPRAVANCRGTHVVSPFLDVWQRKMPRRATVTCRRWLIAARAPIDGVWRRRGEVERQVENFDSS